MPATVRRAALLTLALAGAACRGDKGADGGAAGAATKTIGVTLLTREHDFYKTLEEGMQAAAKAKGYRLVVTSGDFDLAKQQSQLDNFLVQHVDAIVVCPVDSKGIAPAIEKANAAKIPVFTADIAAQGGQVVSHVASDNVAGGRLAADFISNALGGKGEVALVGQPGLQSTIDRETGFKQGLAAHPGLTLVATLDGGGVRDRALKAADDLFQAHPNVAGVFAINDESALGVLSSAQSRKANKVVIVGYDASPEARKAIASGGQLKADVAQEPRDIGVKTIEAIAAHFAGQAPAATIAVPVKIVDAAAVRASAPR
jgi:ribose transport system substrate-binding protein